MATIFNHFYENKNAFLNPCDVIEKISGFPEVCITTFSESIIKDYVENNTTKVIANLYSANGTIPVYEIKYADKKMGLFLSRVGAPACVAGLEEIIAVRCLQQHGIPYVVGKVWTTDAIYRETPEIIEERKKQGCIAVEMECSASLAVAKFRNIPIIQFFYGADNLDSDKWEIRDLTDYGLSFSDKYMTIALECGITF